MLTIDDQQRRNRLGVRHSLAQPASSVEASTDSVVALHATDPASIFLSAHARTHGVGIADVERSLFDDRSMMRTLAMRRTLFVATTRHLEALERSSSIDVAAKERSTLEKYLLASGIKSPATWLEEVFGEVLVATDQSGFDDPSGFPARAITELVPKLATRITMGSGKHTAEAGATSRVLGLMAVEGLLARGRPAGAWTGRQYAWHRRDQWIALSPTPLEPAEAATELVTRWLERFGPGTIDDLKWWTGWTATKTNAVLKTIETEKVELDDGGVGLVLASDTEPVGTPDPWLALLPSLDPTSMGWKERDWYLGGYREPLFDAFGNIGPTIWTDGRIVGGWGQSSDGEVVTELFEKISAPHRKMMNTEVERLTALLGDTIVKPSFPTPLQKKLAAG